MDPAEPHQAAQAPDQGQAAQNGAAAPTGPAEQPLAAAAQPGETAELEALRLARAANETAGGLIARVDQLETKVLRVDRQVLMLIWMVAVLTWSVKSLAGKIGAADAAAAAATGS